jgi:hypothetical protein
MAAIAGRLIDHTLRREQAIGFTEVRDAGDTFATWGEGFSWTGPGGTWYALGR